MSNNQDSKTTFWQFLSQYCIEIPIIQRDYAQGRAGREFLRRNFLRDIKEALDSNQELLLDFVYGSVRGECFLPLDGQQRLTTLWLIHWYIAFRSGKLGEAAETLGKFSYETRLSSREFCKKLCTDMDRQSFIDSETESLKDYIPSQKWFYSLWRQDPTIDAMLRMISGTDIKDKGGEDIMDGIEELFCDITEEDEFVRYWDLLTQPNAPIVFYSRPLESLGLTDDLYIKMNARGKQLTPFENFKADLIGYLQHQKDQAPESASTWEKLLDPQSGIPILMDTSWTELFWQYKSEDCHIDEIGQNKPEECHIDEIYLAFINRFFWNELFYESLRVKGDDSIDKRVDELEQSRSYRYLNADIVDDYVGLAPYCLDGNKDIPQELFLHLERILGNFIRWSNVGKKEIESPKWNKNFSFIPKYDKDGDDGKKRVVPLTQVERIVFFALCKYFLKGEADDVSLARWMRVVWNLISGEGLDRRAEIRNISAMYTAMSFINRLDSHHVYESLCDQPYEKNSTDLASRWNEEIAKAKQILDENRCLRMYDYDSGCSWEDVIKEAEGYAFFNGAIRFLFQDEDGEVSWDNFDKKWPNAQKFFCADGVGYKTKSETKTDPKKDPQLLQALFSRFDTRAFREVLFWKFQVFNNEPWTWRYFLLNKEIYAPIHELLMGGTNIIQTEKPEIENSPTGQEPYEYNVKVVLYQLTQTSLLEFILKQDDAEKYWIRTVNGYYYCYPKYGRDGILLNALDRDNFLRDVEVDEDFIFPGKELFSLVNMPFTFGGHHYVWCSDNKIYLMRDDNPEEYLLTGAETEESTQVFLEYEECKKQSICNLKKELSELAQKHLTAKSE